MKLSDENLETLRDVALEAALQAGNYIYGKFGSDYQIDLKTSGSTPASQVVTEVDLKSQEIILKLIQPTLKDFELALLIEEQDDDYSRLEKDYFWAIDPLDGTLCFVENRSGFSVSISLISKAGIPMIGVVYDPCSGRLFHAVKGKGAFVNDMPLSLNKCNGGEELKVICDFRVHFNEVSEKIQERFRETSYHSIMLLKTGGAVMNALNVLTNTPAIYYKLPKAQQGGGCIWDFGATSCIFNETKAYSTDAFGGPMCLNDSETVFMNEKGVIFTSESSLIDIVVKEIERYKYSLDFKN